MSEDVSLDEGHPLALELNGLLQAVTHFQNEAHNANRQLQRLSLQNIEANQKFHSAERERDALLHEVAVFRDTATSVGASHRDALQVQELTILLRRLSDKLDLADEELLKRNEEIIRANSNQALAVKLESAAYGHLEPLQIDLERKTRESYDLYNRLRSEEEKRKLSDKALEQYADLVRSLEGRRTSDSQSNSASVDGLKHARLGLDKLLRDSNADSEKLHGEISRLHDTQEKLQMQLQAEKENSAELKQSLAAAHLSLQNVERDDKAAAKMVSRYMKFSQTSTDVLHKAIASQRSRQEAIVVSYETRIKELEDASSSQKRHFEQLQRAFEDVTEDISRESFGRRREVSLRLSLLAREEALSERLHRWVLRAKETGHVSDESQRIIEQILPGAEDILNILDGAMRSSDLSTDSGSSLARILAAEETVKCLQNELRRETDLRLFYQRQLTLEPGMRRAASFTPKSIGSKLRLAEMVSHPQTKAAANSISDAEAASKKTFTDNPPHEEAVEWNDVPPDTSHDSSLDPATKQIIQTPLKTDPESLPALLHGLRAEVKAEDAVASERIDKQYMTCPSDSKTPEASQSHGHSDYVVPEEVTSDVPALDEDVQLGMPQEDRPRANGKGNSTPTFAPSLLVSEETETNHASDPPNKFSDVLHRLTTIHDRYVSLQRSFRDCHITLQDMKASSLESSTLPKKVVSMILERLSDHCEDARVELEIRVADEERIAKGYETLLFIPGALNEELNEQDLLGQIESFIRGSEPSVMRARESLNHKLEDLQHDIAVLKRSIADPSLHVAPQEILPLVEERPKQSGWSAWTGSMLAPSRNASPAPSFGAVMTSPRLRRSPSSASLRQEPVVHTSPIASLGLRIPMPSDVPQQTETHHSAPLMMQRGGARPRVVSNMLGLGFKGGLLPSARGPSNFSTDSLRLTTAPPALDLDDDVE